MCHQGGDVNIKIVQSPILFALLLLFVTTSYAGIGFRVSEGNVYTLYRGSVSNEHARIHVGTFDADEKEEYNKGNCEIAQELFQRQPGVSVDGNGLCRYQGLR